MPAVGGVDGVRVRGEIEEGGEEGGDAGYLWGGWVLVGKGKGGDG